MSVAAFILIKMFGLASCTMLFADPWGTPPPEGLWFIPLISAALVGLSAAVDVERLRRGENATWRIGNRILATRISIVSFMFGIILPGMVKSIAEKGMADLLANHFFWITVIAFAMLVFGPIRQKSAAHAG